MKQTILTILIFVMTCSLGIAEILALKEQSTTDALRRSNAAANEYLNKAWEERFDSTGTEVREAGGVITWDGKEFKVRNYKKSDNCCSISLDRNVGRDKGIVRGEFHTHPYSKSEGAYTGVAFSAGDILFMLRNRKKNYVMIVQSGEKRFALVIEDVKKVKRYSRKNSEEKIRKTYQKALENAEGTFPEKVKDWVIDVLGTNSGLKFYEFDSDNENFTEITSSRK